jgi:hypothetical protein
MFAAGQMASSGPSTTFNLFPKKDHETETQMAALMPIDS